MLAKKITFEGLQGPVTEEYLFHITQAQILELNIPYLDENEDADPDAPSGMAKYLQTIVDSNNNIAIYNEFKKIVLMAVGKKSDDGKRFVKTEEIRQDFENTEAYSELIIELMEDAEAAAKFFAGIMPAKVQAQADIDAAPSAEALASSVQAAAPTPAPPEAKPGARVITKAEIASMDSKTLREGLADGSMVIED